MYTSKIISIENVKIFVNSYVESNERKSCNLDIQVHTHYINNTDFDHTFKNIIMETKQYISISHYTIKNILIIKTPNSKNLLLYM